MQKLDKPSISGVIKVVHGPAKTISQSLRAKFTNGGQRIKKVIEPEPSPWPRRFEMIGVATVCIMLIRKALGPKRPSN